MTMYQSLQQGKNDSMISVMAKAFACLSLPLQLIEREQFINMLLVIRQSTNPLPTKRALTAEQYLTETEIRTKVVAHLKAISENCPITLAVDGWTNVRHDKITNVLPLCASNAFYWTSIVNSLDASTAEWLLTPMKQTINDLIVKHQLLIVAIVLDNESVNLCLYDKLKLHFPFLIHVPCAAHTLQLAVHKIIALDVFSSVITTMNNILTAFKISKDKRLQLKRLQQMRENSKTYSLIKPCDTRWSSSLHAATRMFKLKPHISFIMTSITVEFWTGLECLIECLQPFQKATDILQRDKATVFDVYLQFECLLSYLNDIKPSHILFSSKTKALEIVRKYWRKHVKLDLILSVAMLSFDTTYAQNFSADEITSAQDWLISFGVSYLRYYGLVEEESDAALQVNLTLLFASFVGRSGVFSSMQSKIDMFKGKVLEENAKKSSPEQYAYFDAKEVWHLFKNTASQLYDVAIALLSIVPSEAAVERSFSMQGLIHSKLKNRMKDRRVERELFIKFNTRALEKSTATGEGTGRYIELDDNFEEKTRDRSNSLFIDPTTVTVEDDIEDGKEEEEAMHSDGDTNSDYEYDNGHDDDAEDQESEPDPADALDAFVESYILKEHITPRYRWPEHKQIKLQDAMANWVPPIKTHMR